MTRAVLREIRLTAFKSFRDAVLPIAPMTVLIGRNSSGKSNALDGIEVLARLAGGEDLADALDGRRRECGPVRGGSRGCPPHGTASFSLGCTVDSDGLDYSLDVEIQVEPELRIVSERLRGPDQTDDRGVLRDQVLFEARLSADGESVSIEDYHTEGAFYSTYSTRGFPDNRLRITALPTGLIPVYPGSPRAPAAWSAGRTVLAALRGTFHLDPVPHLMRDYVPERDVELRRTGENISAAIGRLSREDEPLFGRLLSLIREVADAPVQDLVVIRSELRDVMFAIREGSVATDLTPAREMSDGLLRFLAMVTALLTSDKGLDLDSGNGRPLAGTMLVIEELENGLHPSQASRLLHLIEQTVRELDSQVLFTTHSPALLNALPGTANHNVIVCYRDRETGGSRLKRLTELPGYATAMASGRLGDLVAAGRLVRPEKPEEDFTEFNRLLGIE